jgi:hypothetical protein
MPCPTCGSLSRRIDLDLESQQIELELRDNVGIHDILTTKGKHGGKGKPYIEKKVGDDIQRKTGKWMKLERTIDHDNDWYEEVIVDPETGRVVHRCAEPLSKHIGHGSARTTKKSSNV